MIDLKKQEELFVAIGGRLKKRLECFVIGGSAMMYYGVNANTKDIDLVFLDLEDLKIVTEILEDLGYMERPPWLLYARKRDVPLLLELGDSRIDLFTRKIIGFKFTDEMAERVQKVHEYGNFIVKIVSPEDIILLKSATERAGDRIDAKNILDKFKINWEIIIEESLKQTKLGDAVFPAFLFDFLSELKEDLKADIPGDVILKIMKIAEKEIIKAKKEGRLFKVERFG